MQDPEFRRANMTLKVQVGKWLRAGEKQKIECIEENDLMRLHNYFDRSSPETLLEEGWFNLTFYFGLRDRDNFSIGHCKERYILIQTPQKHLSKAKETTPEKQRLT